MMKDELNEPRFMPTCKAEFDFTLSFKDGVECITFKNGKTYPLKTIKYLQRRKMLIAAIRKEMTKKAYWQKTHICSRDDPESKGYNADKSDGGKSVDQTVAKIDAPISRRIAQSERKKLIMDAVAYIAERLGYRYGLEVYNEIMMFISTVAERGIEARYILMKKLGLTYHAYIQRITKYSKLLEERRK